MQTNLSRAGLIQQRQNLAQTLAELQAELHDLDMVELQAVAAARSGAAIATDDDALLRRQQIEQRIRVVELAQEGVAADLRTLDAQAAAATREEQRQEILSMYQRYTELAQALDDNALNVKTWREINEIAGAANKAIQRFSGDKFSGWVFKRPAADLATYFRLRGAELQRAVLNERSEASAVKKPSQWLEVSELTRTIENVLG